MLRTILHGADFHLDSPFSGLSPERAAQRRAEQRKLLEDFADLANEQQADVVLLSGDLLDGTNLYRETGRALAQALDKIKCPIFIAAGNHDFLSDGVGYDLVEWPDHVHIFSGELEKVLLPEKKIVVYGRSFQESSMELSPMQWLQVEEDDSWLKLMCVHGEVGARSAYGPIALEEIGNSGLDYLALGHVHKYSGLQRQGETWWAYPGCPEGRGFDETGEKGVLLLKAQPGQVIGQFVSLGYHRYEQLKIDVTGQDPLQAVMASLPEETIQDIYRLELTGSCENVDRRMLERSLRDRFYGLTIVDNTKLPQDIWSRREENSLAGLFLQKMWQKCQEEPDNECYRLAIRFGLAALENGEDVAL